MTYRWAAPRVRDEIEAFNPERDFAGIVFVQHLHRHE